MTKKAKNLVVRAGIGMMILCLYGFPVIPAMAKTETVPVGAAYDVNMSMKDNLAVFTGKRVNVMLSSGANIDGIVKAVGTHFVHIEKITGREFFDALIRIDDISAIDARFREIKQN